MQYFSNPVSQPNLWCFIKLPLPREYISKLYFLMLGHCVNETVCFRVRDYVWIFTFLAKCIVLAVTKLWGRRRRVFLPRFGERWTCITEGVCWIWDEKCNLLEERSNVPWVISSKNSRHLLPAQLPESCWDIQIGDTWINVQ